jgi:hypothetical protein
MAKNHNKMFRADEALCSDPRATFRAATGPGTDLRDAKFINLFS